MKQKKNFFSRKSTPHQSARMVEAIYGCKWSLTVYQLLAPTASTDLARWCATWRD